MGCDGVTVGITMRYNRGSAGEGGSGPGALLLREEGVCRGL